MAKKENSSKAKNAKKEKKKRKNIFGTVFAIVIALALLSVSFYVVYYLLQRGQSAMDNYSGNSTTATEATQPISGHALQQTQMPAIKNDDQSEGYLDGAIYIWNNKGYEVFKGSVTDAKAYAESISNYKTLLGKDYEVYNVVVPSSVEIALPERLSKTVSNNQWENISNIFDNISDDVTPVDVYNILGEKRNEALYYNTDKYWTQLGAYYAYSSLADKLGVKAVNIDDFGLATVESEVLGSHISATISKETKNGNPMLIQNPDTVKYYSLPDTVTVTAMPKASDEITETSYYNSSFEEKSTPIDVYNTKDCAYTMLKNSAVENGKIAIISDKFGYGIAPFLTANYNEIHLIDIDNFERNVKNYLEENEITTVVYLNGIMSANTAAKTAKTDAMF
ncbi:MAG: DHHW family protein [Acutalibacteraceae bacterium]|nr:DHHW family protein [Acutalibacteraceae bacterium]